MGIDIGVSIKFASPSSIFLHSILSRCVLNLKDLADTSLEMCHLSSTGVAITKLSRFQNIYLYSENRYTWRDDLHIQRETCGPCQYKYFLLAKKKQKLYLWTYEALVVTCVCVWWAMWLNGVFALADYIWITQSVALDDPTW